MPQVWRSCTQSSAVALEPINFYSGFIIQSSLDVFFHPKSQRRYNMERIINMLSLLGTARTMQEPTVNKHSGSKYMRSQRIAPPYTAGPVLAA